MRKLILSSLIAVLFLPVAVYAAGEGVKTEGDPACEWELGPEISYITYREPGVVEKGMMYGISGFYAYHNKLMLKVEGRLSYGLVDYKGTGTMQDIPDYMSEFRGLVGYDFSISKASILTPYIGIGYRYLNDDSSGMISSTGYLGYDREISYFYSPIGIEWITNLKNGWSIGPTVEYDIFWWGRVISHLTDTGLWLMDSSNDQTEGYGIRGSIKFQKKCKRLDLILEPFIRYWNINQSKYAYNIYLPTSEVYTIWEPKNNSTEFGCKLAVKF
jgi:hypothetical protein